MLDGDEGWDGMKDEGLGMKDEVASGGVSGFVI